MQFINYFFASAISFFGIVVGILLVRIAPEEQKPLEKYFILSRKILLLLIVIFAIFYYYNDHFNLLVLVVYSIFMLFIEIKIHDLLRKSIIIYSLLGILFFLSSTNINFFAIESSLILLYGLPTASLMYKAKEKNYHQVIFYNLGFIIIANLLYFV